MDGVGDGAGFAFSAEDEIVGVDFDHCLDDSGWIKDPWVADWVDKLESDTEMRWSGASAL